jgi:hypothetical protein
MIQADHPALAQLRADLVRDGRADADITFYDWDAMEERTGSFKVYEVEADALDTKEYSGSERMIAFEDITSLRPE